MKRIFLFAFLLWASFSNAQDYNFSGTMSREKLELYLSRAITMQHMVDDNATSSVYTTQVNMLADINARFIGRACGLWGFEYRVLSPTNYFDKVGALVNNINTAYAAKGLVKPIIQAAIFEHITTDVNGVAIPAYVFTAFGLPVVTRNFNQAAMLYPAPASQYILGTTPFLSGNPMSEGGILTIPDITQTETQLWFYYLATQYISKGCEALHMGQAQIMNRRDIGNKVYWSLLQKIRTYASTRNRGIVLCDAHVFGAQYYEPSISMTQNAWQTYLSPYHHEKQLVWDFHSSAVRMTSQNPHWPSPAVNGGPAVILSDITCGRVYNHMLGGKTYFGWYAKTLPYLVELDNWGPPSIPDTYTDCWEVWGWDEITWFALQSSTYRKNWLKYAYYKIKCLDENAFLEMPGMRGTSPSASGPSPTYRAATGYYNEQSTIRNIWDGVYDYEQEFVHHNFTDEEVGNPPSVPHAQSSLVFVGADKAYYIGTDGYIHAYIKDNGAFGIWRTNSPSFAADVPASSQVKALSDLVASPDGTTLLYKGVDGYIHGFIIDDVWNYTYFNFPTSQMIAQNLKVEKDILFASNSRVFYIANELGTGNKRIHGFVKSGSTWLTTSPTHASTTPSSSQVIAAGALTYDGNKNRLYYVGIDGFLYYHTITTDWTFTYNVVPQSDLIAQSLRIHPSKLALHGDRIYYIGREMVNAKYRIHTLINTGSTWSTLSPSHAAHYYNGQDINSQEEPNYSASSFIAVSPNGKLISYIGKDLKVYYYKDIVGGYNFTYNKTYGNPANSAAMNSLQFNSNDNLFYISTGGQSSNADNKVHFYDLHESYCANPAITAVEPNYTYISSEFPINIESGLEKDEAENPLQLLNDNDIKVFPNPAKDELFVIKNISEPVNYTIINSIGKVCLSGILDETKSGINISTLNSGIYFICISDAKSSRIIRRKFSVVQ